MIKISIGICTYNRSLQLKNCIESILNQSYQNFEIIVVDDFSSEYHRKEVIDYLTDRDERIKFITLEKNCGLSHARNLTIKNASGLFWTFLDDDDAWALDNLEYFISFYSKNLDVNCIYLGYKNLSRYEELSDKKFFFLNDLFFKGITPPVGSQIYSMNLLRKLNSSPYNIMVKSGIDHDLWINLLSFNPRVYCFSNYNVLYSLDFSPSRITTNIKSRKLNIKKSLDHWEEILTSTLSKKFYKHFIKSYKFYLLFSDFYVNYKNKRILFCIYLVSTNPLMTFYYFVNINNFSTNKFLKYTPAINE
jgi:glycosyltransferase involved in cell wall biosynthesis